LNGAKRPPLEGISMITSKGHGAPEQQGSTLKLKLLEKGPRFPCSQSGYAGGENSFLEQMERTK